MKRKKDYKSRGEKFFLEYLPQEVFDSLKPKERENYKSIEITIDICSMVRIRLNNGRKKYPN